MRLTLRSLLGYLDDILEPQQTKELGEKISESGFAASLVARIREVVRRRRITAPEVTGPGSDPDPNVVAEYLDNTLPPDKVEDIERLCIESDVHLAEVAGSHQILTMVLGEPVDIPQSTRERMYSLGAVSDGSATPRTAAATVAPTTPATPTPTPTPKPEVPDYLRPAVSWRQVVPGAAALLVIGLWMGLIFSDPTMKSWRFWESNGVRNEATLSEASTAVKKDVPPEGEGVVPPELAGNIEPDPTVGTPAAIPSTAAEPAGANGLPPLPPANTELTASGTPAVAAISPPTTVMPAELPAAAANPTTAAPIAPTGTGPQPAQLFGESKLIYNATAGVLLRRETDLGWSVLPRRTLLHPGDDLACPEPFESPIQILDTDCEAVMAGPSRMTVLPAAAASRTSFRIDRGRFIFRRSVSAPLPDPTPIHIQLDDRAFLLELVTPGSEVGLEISRQLSAGPADRVQVMSFDGGIFLSNGSVRLTPAEGEPLILEAPAAFLQIVAGRILAAPQPLLSPPAWLTPLTGGTAAVAQQTARLFEDEFHLGTPMDATIPVLVEDRLPRQSELAVGALVLVDDLQGMVRALSAPPQETRQAAIAGLAAWIRRDPAHALRLSDELARRFSSETAQALTRLIWGFGMSDAQDPQLSSDLVAWLGDAEVAVREAAFFQILRLTGGQITYRYHPDRTESQRAMSVKQWDSHVRRYGALIEPAPTPVDPNAPPAATTN
jgi:hypothetical protein